MGKTYKDNKYSQRAPRRTKAERIQEANRRFRQSVEDDLGPEDTVWPGASEKAQE